jgi:hypothetical protein
LSYIKNIVNQPHFVIMKKWFISALMLCAFCAQQATAQITKTINKLPTNMEDFVALRNELSSTPEGGAALFVTAMLMYSQDEALGMQAFTVALDQQRLVEGGTKAVYMGFSPAPGVAQDIRNYYGKHKDHLGNAYIVGTTYTNNYKLSSPPYKIEFTRNNYTEQTDGSMRIFIKCNGADSPRPITLKKNNRGVWKVTTYSSLFVGVRKPPVDDRL